MYKQQILNLMKLQPDKDKISVNSQFDSVLTELQ